MEPSSAYFLSCSTTSFGVVITPSKSTTAILSPKPLNVSFCCDRTLKNTSAKIATRKRKKAPPPSNTQRNTRDRDCSVISKNVSLAEVAISPWHLPPFGNVATSTDHQTPITKC